MEVHEAKRLTVDLLVLLDVSLSMAVSVEGGGRSKASLVSQALLRFVKDPRSAGSGVGLGVFPAPPAAGTQCDHTTYEKPTVPIATLPGGEAALVQTLQDLPLSGDTPMGPAVQGALNQLRRHRAANPTHRVALVLATDGVPSTCTPTDARALGALVSAAAMETPAHCHLRHRGL